MPNTESGKTISAPIFKRISSQLLFFTTKKSLEQLTPGCKAAAGRRPAVTCVLARSAIAQVAKRNLLFLGRLHHVSLASALAFSALQTADRRPSLLFM